ncbi:Do family serine endopeptidase [Candidatus Kinetoplastidibacterium crithidiae]|uniref:Probable periplasmic serine endoprotease DegP-like n=1 Tax=Candidatus Kinetoplastidibacterium crithidiae TCC036E TaxID=1208918 RepID=M1LQ67_9PROT|nr:Do family serine endopeptidase [Candidatus Kinetoplastibacterium crithidii]AFZ82596.1 serine protease [Candidatus Kinetoplastibacterium crithidii (ex Angomonas deanei ATCC 30255)]AGF47742.1 serine endopeptidase [Candidatus Kinetoplastibacterium crithidii TCC036E]
MKSIILFRKRISFCFIIVLLYLSCINNIFAVDDNNNGNSNLVSLPDFTQIIEKLDSSVVNIRTMTNISEFFHGNNDPYEVFRWFFGPNMPSLPHGNNQQPLDEKTPKGLGSGFFISNDGYILTNNHVTSDASEILVTLADGREFIANLVGADDRTDIALLKIDVKNVNPIPIGDVTKVKKGQWVLAIGSPFGLDSTVTAGIVSAIGRDTGEYLPFIQTDVAVNPGNSGGPLLNLKGEVIGINSQIVSRSGGFMGISLSIPIDEAMRVVQHLRVSGKVIRGRIGVQISEVSRQVADGLGLTKAHGALVTNVEISGPADKAGIQAGDVVLKFDNEEIKKWSDLPRIVGQTKPGKISEIEILRRGKKLNIKVKIGEISNDSTPLSLKYAKVNNKIGLEVVDLSQEMKDSLRISGGVLVKSVSGPSLKAGLKVNDILIAINDENIKDVSHFTNILNKTNKKTFLLLVRRGDQTHWMPIKLSD